MEVPCPNCSTTLTLASVNGTPAQCTSCQKAIYFPQQGAFPAIVPLTFPSQTSPSVELVPFFHVSPSQMAPELQNQDGIVTIPNQTMSDVQAQTAHTAIASLEEIRAQAPAQAPPPPPEPEAPPEKAEVKHGDDNHELMSLAGGSFAAALTPPPMPNKPVSDNGALQSMSTTGQAPWDTVAPPPLGKDGKDDQWSVSTGAPPATSTKPPGLPPAIPKRNEIDAFAEALGLPPIPQNDSKERAPPAPVAVPADMASAANDEDDGAELKKYRKKLFLYGGLGFVALVAIAIVVARVASKEPEKPIPPSPVASTGVVAVSGAPADTGVKAASGVSAATSKVEEKPVDPQKRAQALEHYSKGNKLYLQSKYGDALGEYKKALDVDATFALAYRGLGVTYARQNKREKAIESYKAYLRLAPDAKDANQVRAIIQKAESEK